MSGLFKGIGKIFSKVVSVIKKIALPALAIAAVVVTGGAALGLIPAITGLGGLAVSLGASAGVASILSAAATGATIGMIGGLVTSGSISGAIKGASMGFLAGGIAGGIGLAAGGLGGAGSGAATAGTSAATTGTDVVASGIYDGVEGISGLVGTGGAAADVAAGGIGGAVGEAATAAGTVAQAGTSATSGGGILGFLSKNPLIASGLMKGIGGALSGDPSSNLLKERQKSYSGVIPYEPYRVGSIDGLQSPDERFNNVIYGGGKYEYDPATGRVLPASRA